MEMAARRMRAFKRWMNQEGIQCSDALYFTISATQALSITALADLHVGDTVATIPKSTCLTVVTTAARDMIDSAALDGSLGLAVAIMHERSLGELSKWAPYLAVLLKREPILLVWEAEELLRGMGLHETVREDRAVMMEDWKESMEPLSHYGCRFNHKTAAEDVPLNTSASNEISESEEEAESGGEEEGNESADDCASGTTSSVGPTDGASTADEVDSSANDDDEGLEMVMVKVSCSQFTEKSDVYSFAVVLVELLTGKKPVTRSAEDETYKSLATYFIVSMQEDSLFDILDARVVNEGSKDGILAVASLARRCLSLHGRNRPTMKEVTAEMEAIQLSEKPVVAHQQCCERVEFGQDYLIEHLNDVISSSTVSTR